MDSLTNSITQQTTATCVTTNMYTNTYGTTTNDYWISDRTNIWTNPYQLNQHECYIIDGQIISQKTIEKDNNKMNNNFNFGAYQGNNLRMSLYGTAVKNNAGKWVAYDKTTKSLMDVDVFNFDIDSTKAFYKIPKAIDKVQEGDIVLHNNKIVFIESIREDNKFDVIDPVEGSFITILPLLSPFGYNYLTVIISLLDCMPEADEKNPFGGLLPILLSNNNNIGLPLILMQNQNIKDIDPMLLMLAFGNNQNGLSAYFMLQKILEQNKKE